MKKRRPGRGVAVAGAGMSVSGMFFKDRDSRDLFAEAFAEALLQVRKASIPPGSRLFIL